MAKYKTMTISLSDATQLQLKALRLNESIGADIPSRSHIIKMLIRKAFEQMELRNAKDES